MNIERVHHHIERVFPEHLAQTQEFLRRPSISGDSAGLVEAAEWLKGSIEALGGQVVLAGRKKAPLVFARFELGKPKTLLVYGMYDVQPVVGQTWSSPPFAAHIQTVRGVGPSIIARGACNSKGPLMGFLNALRAMREVDEIPLNLILTVEGEEEIGSPNLPRFYRQNKDLLRADAGFEPFWAEYGTDVARPTLTLGTKGIVILELVCRGGEWGGPVDHPVHSSVGAWLASPTWRLIKALGTLVGEGEEIAVKGFYDQVAPPRREDEELLTSLGRAFRRKSHLKLMGARRFKHSLRGKDLLRAYFFSPTMTVNLLGEGHDDVIPSETRARLTIRLVPEMSVRETVKKVRKHLLAHGYGDIQVIPIGGYPWSRTSIREQVVQCMIRAYQYHGCEPQILPFSASATPYYVFSDILGIPYTWGGLGRAGGSHAPDEYASVEGLKLFEQSIATFLYKFAES